MVGKFDLAPKEITAALVGLKQRSRRVPHAALHQ
jgi:hypothetical protein